MRFKIPRILLFLTVAALIVVPANRVAAGTLEAGGWREVEQASYRVLESDSEGMLIELVARRPQISTVTLEGTGYHQVRIPGFGLVGVPGAPQVPIEGLLVGVPAGAEVELRILEVDQELLPGEYRVAPVPTSVVDIPTDELWHSLVGERTISRSLATVEDPVIYGADAFYPASPVLMAEAGRIRHQQIAGLEFYPVRTNPASGDLVFHGRVLLELAFHYPQGRSPSAVQGALQEPEAFEGFLARNLINYETAKAWRSGRPMLQPAPPRAAASITPGYKVFVSRTGIYQLDYGDLSTAGLPVDTLDPRTFQMFYHDQEIAIYVAGEGDGRFDSGDYVLFYGEGISGKYEKYTEQNVYWLTYDQDSGRRMAEKDGTPTGSPVPTSFKQVLHFEEDLQYWNGMPDHKNEDDFARWYWMRADAPDEIIHTPVLTDVMPVTATIEVSIYGGNDDPLSPDHHAVVYVNDNPVGDLIWEGIHAHYAEFDFPHDYLREGSNEVRFEAVLDPGVTFSRDTLDWYNLHYSRGFQADGDVLAYGSDLDGTWDLAVAGFTTTDIETFDVTEPISVSRIINAEVEPSGPAYALRFGTVVSGGAQFWSQVPTKRLSPDGIKLDLPSDLRSPTNQADYVMITHRDFYTDTVPLADHYSGLGLSTMVVDVQDVYDEFSGGVFYPGAIRAFLSYAFEQWAPPAPAYVLLVGDGHSDFKFLNSVTDLSIYVPPYLADVDPWMRETATDNRYVSISGDDAWPDMLIGRFPVNDTGEIQAMVSKSLAYQNTPTPGEWLEQTLFVTDNPDDAGNFYYYSDEIVNGYLPDRYKKKVQKVYLGLPPYTSPADAKAAIKAAISEGRLLVSYTGHSAIPWWAGEQLFHTNDVPGLTNVDKWPVTLPMTCLEGHFLFIWSAFPSLSETMVRAADKGAIASWAPTGLGVAVGHDFLVKGFFGSVFFDGVRRLGEATLEGKRYLWEKAGGSHRDLIETYVLLGDPALRLNIPTSDVQVEKSVEPSGTVSIGDAITYTLAFSNTGPDLAYNVVLTDIIPPQLADPVVVYSTSEVLTQQAGVTFAWNITDLLPHTGGQIQIRAVVLPTVGPGLMVNEAEILAGNDITATNNVVSVSNSIRLPDLVVGKTGPAEVGYSETITYTISWGNQGELAAGNVRITDTLPSWVEYVGDTSGFSVSEPLSGVLVWEVEPDPVPVGTAGSFVLTGWVTAAQVMSGPLINKVWIASDVPEYDPEDNQGQWPSTLLVPDLGVSKTGPDRAAVESTITYTIAYSNTGSAAALGVVITDLLPPGTSYVSDDSGLTHSEPALGTHVWQVGPLSPGSGDTFHLAVRLGSRPEISPVVTNVVQIGAAAPDADASNDESDWSTRVTEGLVYLPLVLRASP